MDYAEVIPLLEQLKDILSMTETFSYGDYPTVEDLLDDVNWIMEGLEINEQAAVEKLHLFFRPAGLLQEIAIDNGWSEIHLEIAKILDAMV